MAAPQPIPPQPWMQDPRYTTALQQLQAVRAQMASQQAAGGGKWTGPNAEQLQANLDTLAQKLAQEYGTPYDPKHYRVDGTTGQLEPYEDHFQRNALLAMGGVLGGGLALGAFGAGAPALATAPSATASGIPVTVGGIPAAGASVGSVSMSAVPPAVAATTGGFSWRNFLSQAVPVVGQLVGAKMAINATDKAAELQTAATDRALDLQRQQFEYAKQQDALEKQRQLEQTTFERQRNDQVQAERQGLFAPYTGLGAAASGSLAYRMGLNPSPSALPTGATGVPGTSRPPTPLPPPVAPYNPNSLTTINPDNGKGQILNPTGPPLSPGNGSQAISRGTAPLSLASRMAPQTVAQAQTQSGYAPVLMRTPEGDVGPVPAELVAHFKAEGAQVVQRAGA